MVSKMYSIFVKERKRYNKAMLMDMLQLEEKRVVSLLIQLRSMGVMKTVKNNKKQFYETELKESDIEFSDIGLDNFEKYLYVFTFVGILTVDGIVIKCYPKYIYSNDEPLQEFKTILKVLCKFDKKDQMINYQNDFSEDERLNSLSLILFLMDDFYENGLYSNYQETLEMDGTGEINWDKTVNETFAFFSNNRPFYPNLVTKKKINDEFDLIKRLHETILTICSRNLENSGILDLFDMMQIILSDSSLSDFGDTEYILDKIQKEMNVQYNTRKLLLLKAMYSFVANSHRLFSSKEFNFYGTNSFHVIWEKVCSVILNNHLDIPLNKLPKKIKDPSLYEPNTTLKRLIGKPKWAGKGISEKEAEKTLTPDLITIQKNDYGDWQFLIFDAKYYDLKLEEGKLKGYPGVESITKQYFYQLAYDSFRKNEDFKIVRNCFLFPTEGQEVIANGEVYMDMFESTSILEKLERIQIRLIPADVIFKYYLKNKKINLEELKL